MRVVFCGDRPVAARIVSFIRAEGDDVVGLGLNVAPHAACPEEVRVAAGVDAGAVFHGRSFASPVAIRRLATAAPDLGVCCGFASILPPSLLEVPRWGWVNVHRSYLPYNRGLDPLQWAMIDGTPAGVSIHVMTPAVDAGPVIAQAEVPHHRTDNFLTLGRRADATAFDLVRSSWGRLRAGDLTGVAQDEDLATYHSRADCDDVRKLDLSGTMNVGRLLDILRSYSGEGRSAVYFEMYPMRFSVHTEVTVAGPPRTRDEGASEARDPMADA